MRDTESRIEDFLADNPEFIDPSLEGILPVRQEAMGKGRTDLTFRKKDRLCIVEIKRTVLNYKNVLQLLEYIESFQEKEHLTDHHFLIGKKGKMSEKLIREIDNFPITLRFLGSDIPLRYLYSVKKRCYIPFQEKLAGEIDLYPTSFFIRV